MYAFMSPDVLQGSRLGVGILEGYRGSIGRDDEGRKITRQEREERHPEIGHELPIVVEMGWDSHDADEGVVVVLRSHGLLVEVIAQSHKQSWPSKIAAMKSEFSH